MLATEGGEGPLDGLVLRAIATGRTKHNEITQAVRAEPARALERLQELRLIERLVPVTDDPRRTRRRLYRIADNFLTFWLAIVEPHKAEIERGLGRPIARVIEQALDEHMGPRFEEALRTHLRRIAAGGRLVEDIVAIGPWWRDRPAVEIDDAVALAGRRREPALAGEAEWSRAVDGPRVLTRLARAVEALPAPRADLRYAVAAREAVRDPATRS